MSAKWEHIPMLDARPNGVKQFKPEEAPLIQELIARQVADLLSSYGDVLDLHVPNVADVDSEIEASNESRLYKFISINSIQLLNGQELTIEQIPEYEDGYYDTRKGLHCVSITEELDSDDFKTIQCYAIWDPYVETEGSRITDIDETPLAMSTLQELYEALIIATYEFANTRDVNEFEYDTVQYPIPVVETELVLIAENENL